MLRQDPTIQQKLVDVFSRVRSLTVATFSTDCFFPLPVLTVPSVGTVALPIDESTLERLRTVGTSATSGTQQVRSKKPSAKTARSTPPSSSSNATAGAAVVAIIPPDKISVSDAWHIAASDAAKRSIQSLSLPDDVAAAALTMLCSLTIEEPRPQGVASCAQCIWQAESESPDARHVADFHIYLPSVYTGGMLSVSAGNLTSYDFSAYSRDHYVCFATLPDANVTSTAITSGARVCLRYSLCLPVSFSSVYLPTVREIKSFHQTVSDVREEWQKSAEPQPPHFKPVPRMLAVRVEGNSNTSALTHSHLTGMDQLRAQLLSACGFSTFVATFSCTFQSALEDLERYRSDDVVQTNKNFEKHSSSTHLGYSDEPKYLTRKRRRTGSSLNDAKCFMSGIFAYRGTDSRISNFWVDSNDTLLDFSSVMFSSADVLELSSHQTSSTHASFLVFCPSSLVLPLALSAGLRPAADAIRSRLRMASTSASALTEAQTLLDTAFASSKSVAVNDRPSFRTAFPSLLYLAADVNAKEKVDVLLSNAVNQDIDQLENQDKFQTLFLPGSIESIAYAVSVLGWAAVGVTVRCLVENTHTTGIGCVAKLASLLVDIDKRAATQITVNTIEKFCHEATVSADDAKLIAYLAFVSLEDGVELRAVIQRCIDCGVKYGKLLELSVGAKNLQGTLGVLDNLLCVDIPKEETTAGQGNKRLPKVDSSQKIVIRQFLSEAFQIHGYSALSEVVLKLVNKYTDDALYWLSIAGHCGLEGYISKTDAKTIGDIAKQHIHLKNEGDNGVRWCTKFIFCCCNEEKFNSFLQQVWKQVPQALLAVLDVTVEMKQIKFIESVLVEICKRLRAPPIFPSFDKICTAVRYVVSRTEERSVLDRVLGMPGLEEIHIIHLAYALSERDEEGVRCIGMAKDVVNGAMIRAMKQPNGILRGNKKEGSELIARDLMKCAVVFGVLHGPLLVRWLAETMAMKMILHCKATEGALDALAGVSFGDESSVQDVIAIVENLMHRACSPGKVGRVEEVANIFAGYVELCRHEAKNVVAISKLVMNGDPKLLQRCLRKRAILDAAHECEWVMDLVKKRLTQIQSETSNGMTFPNAALKDHKEVTSFLKGNFSTMTYRKPFTGVAEAREFAKRYFGNKKKRRRIGARTKTTSVRATAGGRGVTAFVVLQKVPVENGNNDVGNELTWLYRITGEAVDENVHCEEDGDDEVGNGEGNLEAGINEADETEGDYESRGIETVSSGPVRRSSRAYTRQKALESSRKRRRSAVEDNNSKQQNGNSVGKVDEKVVVLD